MIQNNEMQLIKCNKFRYPGFYNEEDRRVKK